MKLAPGTVIDYQPDIINGNDWKKYQVITIETGGRNWQGKRYYALVRGKKAKMRIVDVDHIKPNLYEVEIFDSDYVLTDFSRRPYVRKDGTFNHLSYPSYKRPLYNRSNKTFTGVYGIWEKRDEEGKVDQPGVYKAWVYIRPCNIAGK